MFQIKLCTWKSILYSVHSDKIKGFLYMYKNVKFFQSKESSMDAF